MKAANVFISAFVIVLALIFGQSILLPFLSAMLLWVFVRGMRNFFNRVEWIKKNIPTWVNTGVSTIILITVVMFASKLITESVNQLSQSYSTYQSNIEKVTVSINNSLGIEIQDIVKNNAKSLDYQSILTEIFNSITDLLGNVFMVILFGLFLFLEEKSFKLKVHRLFTSAESKETAMRILNEIEASVTSYLGLKTLVSLVTGTASFVILYLIRIESPIFWAFLIFLLNFIPTIGSLIGTIFPAIFCLLQFGDLSHGLMVLGIVGFIQLLVGNFLEPKIMGNSLNLSPLVAILALSFWGLIWGVTGMILSIPITVIAVIICSQFPQTKSIAILLSEKGTVTK